MYSKMRIRIYLKLGDIWVQLRNTSAAAGIMQSIWAGKSLTLLSVQQEKCIQVVQHHMSCTYEV